MRIPGTARRGLTGASETQAFRTAALARRADADSTSSTARRRNVASAAVRNACLEPFSVRCTRSERADSMSQYGEREATQCKPLKKALSAWVWSRDTCLSHLFHIRHMDEPASDALRIAYSGIFSG